MTVSVVTRIAPGNVEYQKKTYSTKYSKPAEEKIAYDFVDSVLLDGQRELFNAGVKSGGVASTRVPITGPAELLMQSVREKKAAKAYIVSLLKSVTEEARLIPFAEFIKDTASKTIANLEFEESAPREALVLCYDLTKMLLNHYASIIDNSDHIRKVLGTALIELLRKKIPTAINDLARIAPGYIQHLSLKQKIPGVFEQLASLKQELETLEPKLLKDLNVALIKGDYEFFIAYHSDVRIFDDLRAFIVQLPNEIYESVLDELLFVIDDVSSEVKSQ